MKRFPPFLFIGKNCLHFRLSFNLAYINMFEPCSRSVGEQLFQKNGASGEIVHGQMCDTVGGSEIQLTS